MTSLKIRKVGNSLGIILPKEIQDTMEVSEGDVIELTKISKKKMLLETLLHHHSEWKFEESSELSEEDKEWLDSDFGEDEHIRSVSKVRFVAKLGNASDIEMAIVQKHLQATFSA
jgi:putative addiction module antidote